MQIKHTLLLASTFALGAVLLVGCGKKDPSEAVRQRAAERWDLLITHQAVKAYDYLSPGYRSTHTLEQYVAFIATARLRWKSATVSSQTCDTEVCTVHLIVDSTIPGQLAGSPKDIQHSTPVSEKWVISDGQWYFLPDSRIGAAAISNQAGSENKPAGDTPPQPDSPGAAPTPALPPAQDAGHPAP